jgi:hypothetical protein
MHSVTKVCMINCDGREREVSVHKIEFLFTDTQIRELALWITHIRK